MNGCMVLVMVLCVVVTFAMYNADRLAFHVIVAIAAGLGCLAFSVRRGRAEAAAFAVVALPASISAALGHFAQISGDALKGTSGLLYVGGAVLYVAIAAFLASRARQENDAPGG